MTAAALPALNGRFATSTPQEIVAYLSGELGSKLVLASSLGAEDQVLSHMLSGIDATARVVVLDTGRLPQATYDLLQRMRTHTDLTYEAYFPQATAVEELLRDQGPNGFYESVTNRKACCGVRKSEPLARALSNATAWATGQRRSQSVTRTALELFEWDQRHGLVKVNPLASWSSREVWDYLREHDVPYSSLHDEGFPSIGCAPCTRAVSPGEDERAGRWWWERPESRECGIHIQDGVAVRDNGAAGR